MRTLRFLIPLVASCLLATGCSLAKYGYDAFPMYANWQLDSYLDLDDEQTDLAKRTIDQLMVWHKKTELPKYASFLRDVDARVIKSEESADVLQVGDVNKWREKIQSAWPPLVEQVVVPVTKLLVSLQPDQVEHLRGKFETANKDMTKKWKLNSPKGMLEARGDRIIERAEFFMGRLSGEQKQDLRDQAAALPTDEPQMFAERLARQQKLLDLIKRLQTEKPAAATGEKWTRDYLLALFSPQDPQRRSTIEATQQASDQMTARVINKANGEQRKKLSKTLQDFAKDFEKRAREVG